MSKPLPWTGERYIPGLPGNIALEHKRRYDLATKHVAGLAVLDIASGEGYGTAMLAKTACTVLGMDVAQDVVDYANYTYANGRNIGYAQGSCVDLPLPDHSIDAVISFETLEHHDQHVRFMCEVLRVLREDGFLIISSPNKRVYSDIPNYRNPFHVKELYLNEFQRLMGTFFKHVDIYGQKLMGGGSCIAPINAAMEDSMYYIAVASNAETYPKLGNDFFTLPTNQ